MNEHYEIVTTCVDQSQTIEWVLWGMIHSAERFPGVITDEELHFILNLVGELKINLEDIQRALEPIPTAD